MSKHHHHRDCCRDSRDYQAGEMMRHCDDHRRSPIYLVYPVAPICPAHTISPTCPSPMDNMHPWR